MNMYNLYGLHTVNIVNTIYNKVYTVYYYNMLRKTYCSLDGFLAVIQTLTTM